MKLEKCPACGEQALDLCKYRSMMVLSGDKALFQLRCPRCGAVVASVFNIPEPLLDQIKAAALELGAGMGRDA